jgi:hypothetical protein
MEFAVHCPINSLSFGQVSINILKELYKRKLSPAIFPIADVDVRAHNLDAGFKEWLESCANKSYLNHQRKNPTFKLWHIQGSLESLSNKSVLFTFHETDEATPAEVNIVNNNTKVLFSSNYSKGVFENFGGHNTGTLQLGFDADSFKILDKKNQFENRITFGLAGKLEKRKQHHRILNLWAKKYGNRNEYALNCALYNQFLPPEVQEGFRRQALEGQHYWNINWLPFMENNSAYNDFLNNNDIIIGMSSAEGWGLPEFQSVALGKHGVILNATGYKEWATPENVVLVNPSGKIPLYDNVFFKQGMPFAQGSGYDWTDEAFYSGIDKAIERFKKNPTNEEGIKLQEKFTYAKTVDKILDTLGNL